MSEQDPEFEDFLRRRRPLFPREADDGLEPPAELDRIVLRQAREAIRAERPLPLYRGPKWAAPLAIAATLLLALGVVFHVAERDASRPGDEVSIERAAQRREPATAAAAPVTAPEWRRDPATWLAEIERLRAAGETQRAEAEQAEYNRQQRAFAGSDDR